MAIEVRAAAFGPESTTALRELLGELRGGDPLAPATVLVPTNYVGVAVRRSLAWGVERGLAGVSFSTVYRLAELLGAARLAGDGRRPVSTPVLAAAVRAVLLDDPGVFEVSREHPATEKALLRAHRDLSNLESRELDALARQGRRAADVVRVHRSVASRLERAWYGEQDLLAAATAAIDDEAPALAGVGPVIAYLPDRFTAPQRAFLQALARSRRFVILAGTTGDPEVDSETVAELERFEGLPPIDVASSTPAPVGASAISVSDADDEVRTVVRLVVDAAREGLTFDRMAVLYGSEQPYSRLLHEQLAAAEVPFNGAALGTLAESLAGRTALGLLALPERDYHRADLMALLNSAPIRHGGRLVQVGAWERISRASGVVRGAAEWDQRLRVLIVDRRVELEAAEADPERPWRAESLQREIDRAERLWAFVVGLVSGLEKGSKPASWTRRCGWLRGLLAGYLGGESVREPWPEQERTAAERIDAILDRLAGLDEIEPNPSLSVFRRTFELEMEGGLGRHGLFGEGLLVGGLHMGVGLDLDQVWIMGMAEGLLPSRPRDDSLLPDRERAVAGGGLPTRAQRLLDQRRHFLATLGAAKDGSTLTFPRGDLRRSNERMPSRWLLEAATEHEGRRVFTPDLADLGASDWFSEIPSQVAGLLATSNPVSQHEYDVLSVLEARWAGRSAADTWLATSAPAYQRGVAMIEARASRDFTRFDGNLAGLAIPGPTDPDQVVSPTRLESWSVCPHAYFMRYLLGVQPVETPEAVYSLGPLERGNLVHQTLDRWLSEILGAGSVGAGSVGAGSAGAGSDSEAWTSAQRQRLAELGAEECARLEARGVTGGRVRWRYEQRVILADLAELVDRDNVRRAASRFRAVASEMRFGLPDSGRDALDFALTDGRTMRFRGSADRVDVGSGGEIVVIDYKTGSDNPFRKLGPDDPDLAGTKLQLPIYAAVARDAFGEPDSDVRAAYWFVSSKRDFRLIDLPLTEAVAARIDEVLTSIADGIAAGVFPQHPEPEKFSVYTSCRYCDPDDLGTRDLRRVWERKASAPELRAYLRLADPDRAALQESEEAAR